MRLNTSREQSDEARRWIEKRRNDSQDFGMVRNHAHTLKFEMLMKMYLDTPLQHYAINASRKH